MSVVTACLAAFAPSCVQAQPKTSPAEGTWLGWFTLRDSVQSPFRFEIDGDGSVHFLNAQERFYSGKAATQGDSIFIPLDQFDNELRLQIKGDRMKGLWRRQDGTGYTLRVVAEKGKFSQHKNNPPAPTRNFSGKYEITFNRPDGTTQRALVMLDQEDQALTGTFLKLSYDSRYLEGIVRGDSFYLSTFIGATPEYYHGRIDRDGNIEGEQVGTINKQSFEGKFDNDAQLPDSYSLTRLKTGYSSLDFSFPDVHGNKVSLKDDRFRNKVVIITITGTWCPNCIDEAAYMSPWYKKNRSRGVEVIAVHYERNTDMAYARKVMERFRERFDIRYIQVLGGHPNKDSVARSLPALEGLISFPTTIIIGRDGNVAKIHTGYMGPATGIYHDEFVKEFSETIDRLLSAGSITPGPADSNPLPPGKSRPSPP